jgi:cytosine/adenosine deaminase-related metal-dependent hydrolase
VRFVLEGGRLFIGGGFVPGGITVSGGRVATAAESAEAVRIDLAGRIVLPGIVNGHDHLDFSAFTPQGRPPYPSLYAWAADVNGGAGDPFARAALAVPHVERLWLGGLRSVLSGVTAVAHHGPFHRSLGRPEFPVRVLQRYQFAHSPGLTRKLKETYRSTDRRIPWMIHAGEGTDEACRGEIPKLDAARLLRENTVIIHGIAVGPAEAARLAAAGAAVVWCPESNRRLYGATAPVPTLRAAGVALGLGSDSPVSGVRDAISNLAAARAEGVLSDTELLDLATQGSARVARLPVGGFAEGDAADLLVVDSVEGLLQGDRRAIVLLLRAGEALYGEPSLLQPLCPRAARVTVDGAERGLLPSLARRFAAALRDHPFLRRVAWIDGIGFD